MRKREKEIKKKKQKERKRKEREKERKRRKNHFGSERPEKNRRPFIVQPHARTRLLTNTPYVERAIAVHAVIMSEICARIRITVPLSSYASSFSS